MGNLRRGEVAAGLGRLALVVAFERFDSASVVILVAAAAAPGGLVLVPGPEPAGES